MPALQKTTKWVSMENNLWDGTIPDTTNEVEGYKTGCKTLYEVPTTMQLLIKVLSTASRTQLKVRIPVCIRASADNGWGKI